MGLIEWIGFCVSIFGMYGLVIYLRFLLPCYLIPNVWTILDNAAQSLSYAVTTGAISEMSEYRVDLEILANQFAGMRLESHRSPGFLQQIWLAIRHGLTYRLYTLASQIDDVRLRVEVVTDERRLAFLQIVVSNPPPIPAGDVAIPLTHIAVPVPP